MLPYLRGRGRAPMWRAPAMEAGMTREELASKLDHLDPGATLSVPEAALAALFGEGRLSKEAVAMIEAFALEHRCTFSVEHGWARRPSRKTTSSEAARRHSRQ